jgi:hypothetical protein
MNMDEQPQSGSILDRIITSQQTETLERFHPVEIVNELLKSLSIKEADIIRRRFGLGPNPAETLEVIGESYKVTRERIRQIQRWAIDRLKKSDSAKRLLRGVDMLLQQLFEEHGGLMPEDELFTALMSHAPNEATTRAATTFILEEMLSGKFTRIAANDTKPYWKPSYAKIDALPLVLKAATRILESAGKPLPGDQLLESLAIAPELNGQNISSLIRQTYLSVAPDIERNPFGEYGLRSWGSIVPKRMNDKIMMVLRKSGQPMHFTEITQRINEIGFDHRQAYPPTVHNELILNKEYVLVGRGIYALKEWGYQPGVVADVIEAMIKAQGPMSREEIVAAVLKQRLVKKNTIHLALTNKQRFARTSDGRYNLVGQNSTNHSQPSTPSAEGGNK